MKRATMAVHDLARRLMAQEHRGSELPESRIRSGPQVCEKLGGYLEKPVGVSGAHYLVSRAIVLATEDAHWLREVKVNSAGLLDGFIEGAEMQDDEEAEKGSEDILAEMLGLIITFIGE